MVVRTGLVGGSIDTGMDAIGLSWGCKDEEEEEDEEEDDTDAGLEGSANSRWTESSRVREEESWVSSSSVAAVVTDNMDDDDDDDDDDDEEEEEDAEEEEDEAAEDGSPVVNVVLSDEVAVRGSGDGVVASEVNREMERPLTGSVKKPGATVAAVVANDDDGDDAGVEEEERKDVLGYDGLASRLARLSRLVRVL